MPNAADPGVGDASAGAATPFRLSVLDQAPVPEGSTGAEALRNSVELARLADRLGYHRYWVAEHHGTPALACASPEALIGPIAAATVPAARRQRRRHAAALQPAQGGRDLQHVERPVPRPDRPGRRPRPRHRHARPPSPSSATAGSARPTTSPSKWTSCWHTSRTAMPPDHPFARLAALPGRPERPRALAAGLLAAERRSGRPGSACRTSSPTSSTRPARRSPPATASSSCRRSAARGAAAGRGRVGGLRRNRRRGPPAVEQPPDAHDLMHQGQLIPVPPVEKALRFLADRGEPPDGMPPRQADGGRLAGHGARGDRGGRPGVRGGRGVARQHPFRPGGEKAVV